MKIERKAISSRGIYQGFLFCIKRGIIIAMSREEHVLTKEVVSYIMTHYKDLLKEVVIESIEAGMIPDIRLIQEEGKLFLDITYKEIKCIK